MKEQAQCIIKKAKRNEGGGVGKDSEVTDSEQPLKYITYYITI